MSVDNGICYLMFMLISVIIEIKENKENHFFARICGRSWIVGPKCYDWEKGKIRAGFYLLMVGGEN